jgi:hypothetical protein
MDALELDLHLLAQRLVERAERLVKQHDVGLEHQRTRQRDALLLLPAGEFGRFAVREVGEADHGERVGDALPGLRLR